MKKYCYVCGREIADGEFYYSAGANSYVCKDEKCYDFYFWDHHAARMAQNIWHEYAIINGKVYQFGSNYDEPRGFGGHHWHIHFLDGTDKETNSLWLIGDLPDRLKNDFKNNAIFVKE